MAGPEGFVIMPKERWEHFHHDADIGVRGFGPTKEAAFEQTARSPYGGTVTVRRIYHQGHKA